MRNVCLGFVWTLLMLVFEDLAFALFRYMR